MRVYVVSYKYMFICMYKYLGFAHVYKTTSIYILVNN